MVNHRIIIFASVNPKSALSIRRKDPARTIDKSIVMGIIGVWIISIKSTTLELEWISHIILGKRIHRMSRFIPVSLYAG
jgi:hypothetical protein|tara:strand:- start:702 stop:938 length:237 start_codon:yes stop_codon:yes gene_type:complete